MRDHVRVPVQVEISMVSENNFWAGITDNISEGGIFVATHQPPEIGAEVELMLLLPESEESFLVTGTVRWIRSYEASCDGMPPGCGLEWEQLPVEALRAIQRFVGCRETLYYEAA